MLIAWDIKSVAWYGYDITRDHLKVNSLRTFLDYASVMYQGCFGLAVEIWLDYVYAKYEPSLDQTRFRCHRICVVTIFIKNYKQQSLINLYADGPEKDTRFFIS